MSLGFYMDWGRGFLKLRRLNWFVVGLLCVLAAVGSVMLYSAAGMDMQPWAQRHIIRFFCALAVILAMACINIRLWYRWAYVIFALVFCALLIVEWAGYGSGAQRWIYVFGLSLQPSEFMKAALILALSRYFNDINYSQGGDFFYLLPPLAMVAVVAALIAMQPDLGTAVMIILSAFMIFWLAGVHRRWFLWGSAMAAVALPAVWQYLLYDYQKRRLLVFLQPDKDPLGESYHILQSKIALGSGGLFGKGWGQGSQSALEFLPEKHTDFIFTMIAEEFGFMGILCVLTLYLLLIAAHLFMLRTCRCEFCRLLILGIGFLTILFVLINTAMVSGLLPVVGVPLPFVSYGGSAMLALSLGYGWVLSAHVHYDTKLPCGAGRRL